MAAIISEHHMNDRPLPPALGLLLVEGYLDQIMKSTPWEDWWCSPEHPSKVSIGDYTLDDWLKNRVTAEELWLSAQAAPDSGAWRTLGHFNICVEKGTYERGSHTAILGFTTRADRLSPSTYSVLFADMRTTFFNIHELPALAEAHDGPPLPESFFALFNQPR